MSKVDNEHCNELALSIEDLLTEYTRFKGDRAVFLESLEDKNVVVIEDRHSHKKYKVTIEIIDEDETDQIISNDTNI